MTVDDLHETLSYLEWLLRPIYFYSMAHMVTENALLDIEASLPKPCDYCGSDQCRVITLRLGISSNVWAGPECQKDNGYVTLYASDFPAYSDSYP